MCVCVFVYVCILRSRCVACKEADNNSLAAHSTDDDVDDMHTQAHTHSESISIYVHYVRIVCCIGSQSFGMAFTDSMKMCRVYASI